MKEIYIKITLTKTSENMIRYLRFKLNNFNIKEIAEDLTDYDYYDFIAIKSDCYFKTINMGAIQEFRLTCNIDFDVYEKYLENYFSSILQECLLFNQ